MDEIVNVKAQIRAHRTGFHENLLIQNAPIGQPMITESKAIAPVTNVAIDVSN